MSSNVFNKLLNTLLENSKTRYMILDNRTTPFFSTILYLELPNEVIMTDFEIKKEHILEALQYRPKSLASF